MNYRAELLSPAGSYEGFLSVLGAGADAVYLGGNMFGARAYAQNFTDAELLQAIRTAHVYDKKLYLTVNTLLKNKEIETALYNYMKPLYEEGLDAVLVQDFGVLQFMQEYFPGLDVHASTQMAVTGPEGMKLLERRGLTRIVAARELSLAELRAMHEASGIEIEAFVHGALCYSYSGRCLMSSMIGQRSGNRGRCAQPCRLPYRTALENNKFENKKDFCPLSLKDMDTLELLPDILNAGVYSLKIEGRMKKPEYAAGVTRIYRKYLDLLNEKGEDAYRVDARDASNLKELFSRGGSCTGYFDTYNGKGMMAFANDKKSGDVKEELKQPVAGISGQLTLLKGETAALTVWNEETAVHVLGDMVEEASSRPLDEMRVRQQMNKLGNTGFYWEDLSIEMSEDIFVPIGMLNKLRRETIEGYIHAKADVLRREDAKPYEAEKRSHRDKTNGAQDVFLTASCETMEQAKELLSKPEIRRLYVPMDLAEQLLDMHTEQEIYLSMPEITRNSVPRDIRIYIERLIDKGLSGILVKDLEETAFLIEAGYADRIMLDASMYSWNDRALAYWKQDGIAKNTIPAELNEKEIAHRENMDAEMIVYGYQPLMISAQCVRKNVYGCNHKNSFTRLKDRKDMEFTVSCVCDPWKGKSSEKKQSCYNVIYNSVPLGLLNESKKVKNLGITSCRLSFTKETPREMKGILRDFVDAYVHGAEFGGENRYTKGHFKRGAV